MEIYCNKNKIMKTSTYIFPFLSLYLFILTLHKFVRNGMRYNFTLLWKKGSLLSTNFPNPALTFHKKKIKIVHQFLLYIQQYQFTLTLQFTHAIVEVRTIPCIFSPNLALLWPIPHTIVPLPCTIVTHTSHYCVFTLHYCLLTLHYCVLNLREHFCIINLHYFDLNSHYCDPYLKLLCLYLALLSPYLAPHCTDDHNRQWSVKPWAKKVSIYILLMLSIKMQGQN